MPANRRFRARGPRACVPGIVRRYRGFRQGTDNEQSLALGGRSGSHVAVESALASRVREPDSCCSSRRRPPPNYPRCSSRARLNLCLPTGAAETSEPIQRRQTPVSRPEQLRTAQLRRDRFAPGAVTRSAVLMVTPFARKQSPGDRGVGTPAARRELACFHPRPGGRADR